MMYHGTLVDTDDHFEVSFTRVNTDGHFEVPWVWGSRWRLVNTHCYFQGPRCQDFEIMAPCARMCPSAFPRLLPNSFCKPQQGLQDVCAPSRRLASYRFIILAVRLRVNGEWCQACNDSSNHRTKSLDMTRHLRSGRKNINIRLYVSTKNACRVSAATTRLPTGYARLILLRARVYGFYRWFSCWLW